MIDLNISLPLDKLGTAASNLVAGEEHELINRPVRAILPEYGSFYAASVVIVDDATGIAIDKSKFKCGELVTEASKIYGKRICDVILITDQSVSNNVSVTYQALGGEINFSKKKLRAAVEALQLNGREVDWDNVLDKPKKFQPKVNHLHNTTTVYGTEYLEEAILRTGKAISIGSKAGHDEITNYITALVDAASGNTYASNLTQMALHKAAADPHSQYVMRDDIYSLLSVVRVPKNITPAASAANVGLDTQLVASPYYTLYGIAQGQARFQVASSADFSTGVALDTTVNGAVTSLQPSTLFLPNTTYYWRVKYIDSEGVESAWSTVTSFVTANIQVAAPSITSPAEGTDTNTEGPTLVGTAFSVVGATDTHAASDWEIWTGPNATGVRIWSSPADTANKTSINVPTGIFTRDTKYYARVRYKGTKYGYSNWSDIRMFNATWPLRPTVIGQVFGGGYWAGDIVIGAGTYAVIVAPKATGETTMALTTQINSVANTSAVDSVANTAALNNSAGVSWVRSLSIGGYSDWVIPARNVLTLMYNNLKPSLTTIPTNFKTGGVDAFTSAYYRGSTAYNWVDSGSYPDTPNYANVNHVDCSYNATAWYGPSDGAGPPASCPRGTVSNYRVGYFFSINPSTGQPGSLNTSYWCCNWIAYEVVSYTPGGTYSNPYYDAYIRNLATGTETTAPRNTSSYRIRAVRLVRVA